MIIFTQGWMLGKKKRIQKERSGHWISEQLTRVYSCSFAAPRGGVDFAVIVQRAQAQKSRGISQLFLNSQKLVVFGNAIGARSRSGLDLSCTSRDCQIGDERVFGLSRTMRNHARIVVAPRKVNRIQGFTHGADLVDLDQNRIRSLLFNALSQARGIRDKQIIAYKLYLAS